MFMTIAQCHSLPSLHKAHDAETSVRISSNLLPLRSCPKNTTSDLPYVRPNQPHAIAFLVL